MTAALFVVVAAAFTIARVLATFDQPSNRIPWRTLAVNTSGAFALGLIVAAGWFDDPLIVSSAGLGSLTTFSTVASETAQLLEDGRRRDAIAYVGITVIGGIAAAWLGLSIGD